MVHKRLNTLASNYVYIHIYKLYQVLFVFSFVYQLNAFKYFVKKLQYKTNLKKKQVFTFMIILLVNKITRRFFTYKFLITSLNLHNFLKLTLDLVFVTVSYLFNLITISLCSL